MLGRRITISEHRVWCHLAAVTWSLRAAVRMQIRAISPSPLFRGGEGGAQPAGLGG
jgi:hypothetical protein